MTRRDNQRIQLASPLLSLPRFKKLLLNLLLTLPPDSKERVDAKLGETFVALALAATEDGDFAAHGFGEEGGEVAEAAEADDADVVGGFDVVVEGGEDGGAAAHEGGCRAEGEGRGDVEGGGGGDGEVRGEAAGVVVGFAVELALCAEDFGAGETFGAVAAGLGGGLVSTEDRCLGLCSALYCVMGGRDGELTPWV